MFKLKVNIQIFSLLLCIVPVSVFKFPYLVRSIFNSLLKKRSEFRKMLSKRSSLLYRQPVKWSLKEVCFFSSLVMLRYRFIIQRYGDITITDTTKDHRIIYTLSGSISFDLDSVSFLYKYTSKQNRFKLIFFEFSF